MTKFIILGAALMCACVGAGEISYAGRDWKARFDANGALVSFEGVGGEGVRGAPALPKGDANQKSKIINHKSQITNACVVPSTRAFEVAFLDEKGEETILSSADFTCTHEGDSFVYHRAGGPRVELAIRAAEEALYIRPKVCDWPKGMILNWIDAPQVCVSTNVTTFWPYYDCALVTDYTTRVNPNRHNAYRRIGWLKRYHSFGGLYPGFAQMQFLAGYSALGKGVYFGARDEKHIPKAVEWEFLKNGSARYSLQTFCGDAKGGVYESPFEYEIRPFTGDWRGGCDIYREWIRTLPAFATKPKLPEWAASSPVIVIYPVKGEGIDHGPWNLPANRYFPYMNAMPAIEKYGKAFNSKVMALLMHWEGTAPWAPPYVWPPFGGEKALAAFRDALHKRGDLLGLYCSGTGWTQESCIDFAYTQTQKFADENLGRFMCRGPKGEIDSTICCHPAGQRFGFDMCVTEAWCRRTLIDEAMKMARFGTDYCQFFDQNLGGGAYLCWSKNHQHAAIPSSQTTAAMVKLQKDILAEIAAAGSHMTLGCEGTAATPFVPTLFFNDARPGAARALGRYVPGLTYVFHEWMCNFSGNQGAQRAEPAFRWARSFHAGDMMSVILGPDDKLVTGWGIEWSKPLPDQKQLMGLVKRFNDLRKKYPQFLLTGRMIQPFVKVNTRDVLVTGEKKPYVAEEVLSSFWEDGAGNTIGFLTNWRQTPARITLQAANGSTCEKTLAPLETIEITK